MEKKSFKQILKTELSIFINNFIMVLSIYVGYDIFTSDHSIIGLIVGSIVFLYGFYLLIKNSRVVSKNIIEEYFPKNTKK